MSESSDAPEAHEKGGLSRRTFLKALGTTAVASAAAQANSVAQELQKHNDEKVFWAGPGFDFAQDQWRDEEVRG